LYIDQDLFTKSSAIIRDYGQRPDFLVVEPNKMPFFVDVKARTFASEKGELNCFYGNQDIPAIFWSTSEYQNLSQFQSLVGIPIWIAFFERRGENNVDPSSMYLVPLNVTERFLRQSIHKYFFQIPKSCCEQIDNSKSTPLSHYRCFTCKKKYCEEVNDLINKMTDAEPSFSQRWSRRRHSRY